MTNREKEIYLKYANQFIKEAAARAFEDNYDFIGKGITGAQNWLNKKLDTKNSGFFGKLGKGVTNFILNDVLLGIGNDAWRATKLLPRSILGGYDLARGKISAKEYAGLLGDSAAGAAWTALNVAGAGIGAQAAKAGLRGAGKAVARRFADKTSKQMAKEIANNTAGKTINKGILRKETIANPLSSADEAAYIKAFKNIKNPAMREKAFKDLPKEVQEKVYSQLSSAEKAYNANLVSRELLEKELPNIVKDGYGYRAITNANLGKQPGLISSLFNPLAGYKNLKQGLTRQGMAKDFGLSKWDRAKIMGQTHMNAVIPMTVAPSLYAIPATMTGQEELASYLTKPDEWVGWTGHKNLGTYAKRNLINSVDEDAIRNIAQEEKLSPHLMKEMFTRSPNGNLEFDNAKINNLANYLYNQNPELAESAEDLALQLKGAFSSRHANNSSGFLFDKAINRLSGESKNNIRTPEEKQQFRQALSAILSSGEHRQNIQNQYQQQAQPYYSRINSYVY